MGAIRELFSGAIGLAFVLAYGFGGFVGAVYWAIQRDILNVVLSIFIPLYGAISVVWDLL